MLTIHSVPISVHGRKVIVAAILKGLDYEVDPVIPFNPPEGWRELSPTGLVPAITDGAFTLADSTAICGYLERKYPDHPLLPADPAALGRSVWFDAYAGGMFRDLIRGLFFERVIRPNILGEPGDASVVDDLRTGVEPTLFGYLERQAGDGFLVGGQLTLGDLAVASNLINYRYLGFAIDRARYPRLAAYAERMDAQPAFRQALAAEQPFAERLGLDRSFLAQATPAAA